MAGVRRSTKNLGSASGAGAGCTIGIWLKRWGRGGADRRESGLNFWGRSRAKHQNLVVSLVAGVGQGIRIWWYGRWQGWSGASESGGMVDSNLSWVPRKGLQAEGRRVNHG